MSLRQALTYLVAIALLIVIVLGVGLSLDHDHDHDDEFGEMQKEFCRLKPEKCAK